MQAPLSTVDESREELVKLTKRETESAKQTVRNYVLTIIALIVTSFGVFISLQSSLDDSDFPQVVGDDTEPALAN